MEMKWSNEMGHRGRKGWLLLVVGDVIIPFDGSDIQGILVIRGTDYHRNGKWSHTIYRLELADGVRTIVGFDGWETGRVTEGLARAMGKKTPDLWADLAEVLGVSVPSAMRFMRSWREKSADEADKLDAVERRLVELEDAMANAATDAVIITVSFGSPSNRRIAEGFWDEPKAIPGYPDAFIRKIQSAGGWVEGNIAIDGIGGTVISVSHVRGMHGGYYAVNVGIAE